MLDTLGERLKSLHPNESRLAFAKRMGVSDSTLGNYERDERTPDADFLARLRERAGTDLNWLVNGESRALSKGGEDVVLLPRYDIQASAGRGALVQTENVAEYFSVGRDWLRRQLPPWAPANAKVGILEGGGDSMEPTIRDGDLIMVVEDVPWRVVDKGGIFIFALDEHLLLKRLQILMNGDLKIISDNKAYEPELVEFKELPHRFRLIAQVFFAGGGLRSLGEFR